MHGNLETKVTTVMYIAYMYNVPTEYTLILNYCCLGNYTLKSVHNKYNTTTHLAMRS